jgi:hypothetical protein
VHRQTEFRELIRNWSGREDLNLRPLGPEPNVSAPISEGFLGFPTGGSNGVAIRQPPDPAFADHDGRPPRRTGGSLSGNDSRCYRNSMTLKARVTGGRLVLDEATDLPEGTEVELLALDPGDWLDEDGRAALHQALEDSDEDVKAGRLVAADVILRELRSR